MYLLWPLGTFSHSHTLRSRAKARVHHDPGVRASLAPIRLHCRSHQGDSPLWHKPCPPQVKGQPLRDDIVCVWLCIRYRFLNWVVFLWRMWTLPRWVQGAPLFYIITLVWFALWQAYGSFPCEQSVLDIEKDLDWNPQVTSVTSMPLSIYDDGSIIYFK